jgi:DNA-binding GntR family transcriptional regulator
MSAKHPVRDPSRADAVYAQLKRDISEFRWLPGDRFTEMEVCDRHQVSRTPVRQALFRLQQEGFVDVHFRSGWEVKPFDFEKFDHLYDLRILIETAAVERLCQPEAHAVDLRVLAEQASIWMVDEHARCTDRACVAQWDEAFHMALVQACGNPEMQRVHREITERIRSVRRLDFTLQDRIQATYVEHARILQAVLTQQAEAVKALLTAHIQTSQSQVRNITLHQIQQARRLTVE